MVHLVYIGSSISTGPVTFFFSSFFSFLASADSEGAAASDEEVDCEDSDEAAGRGGISSVDSSDSGVEDPPKRPLILPVRRQKAHGEDGWKGLTCETLIFDLTISDGLVDGDETGLRQRNSGLHDGVDCSAIG